MPRFVTVQDWDGYIDRAGRTRRLVLEALAVAATVLVLAGTVDAASDPEAPRRDATIRPVSTQQFVQLAAASNQFGIDSGRLALGKAADPRVKQLAETIIAEHERAGQEMATLARAAGVNAPRPALDGKQADVMQRLGAAAGPEFDRAFVQAQQEAHTQAIALFGAYAETGEDVRFKAWAQTVLPTLQRHLQQVNAL